MTRRLIGSALLCVVMGGSAVAQVSPKDAQKTEEAAHLVGHEDAALLRRIAGGLEEWDPRNLESPYLKRIQTESGKRWEIRRPDLLEFIADPDAAVVLGKALFWEMAAGSDFQRQQAGGAQGTACASCHYRFGADARNRNTQTIAFPAWKKFAEDRKLPAPTDDYRTQLPPFTQRALDYIPNGGEIQQKDFFSALDPKARTRETAINGLLSHEIIGSQGVVRQVFQSIGPDGVEAIKPPEETAYPQVPAIGTDMFFVGDKRSRQITQRNSPSVINAVMNDRQFHDGRAESTFNGFSIFGDFDKRVPLKRAFLDANNQATKYVPVSVAIVKASLGSQAVGPIVNEVEMSYLGRSFHDVAYKLLDRQALSVQDVSTNDSVFGKHTCTGKQGLFLNGEENSPLSYRQLIRKAFRKEWWGNEAPLTEGAELKQRLAEERAKFEKLFNEHREKLLAIEPDVKKNVTNIQADLSGNTLVFPATAITNELVAIYGNSLSIADTKTKSALRSLVDSVQEWKLIEAEILPLREYDFSKYKDTERRIAWHEEFANRTREVGSETQDVKNDLMVNNFSLFWGLSIMLYESTLISNDSPFDQMLRGHPEGIEKVWDEVTNDNDEAIALNNNAVTPPMPTNDNEIRKIRLDESPKFSGDPVLSATAMFQRGMRVFVTNCSDCHEAPYFTSVGELELTPELPDPIAKLHSHSLVRPAWADAFKKKLLEETGAPKKPNLGVTDAVRSLLGNRAFFTDLERITVVEEAVAELMVEYMQLSDRMPVALIIPPGLPGRLAPPREPMITWFGTRPPLSFQPTRRADEKKKFDPYVFYDLGFYVLGVSEPRYDWGVWGFPGAEIELTVKFVNAVAEKEKANVASRMDINDDARNVLLNQLATRAEELRGFLNEVSASSSEAVGSVDAPIVSKTFTGPDLGSAYQLKQPGVEIFNFLEKQEKAVARAIKGDDNEMKAFKRANAKEATEAVAVDHTNDRNYIDPAHERKDVHFFKRGRRMVMSEESWGHRKPFIEDNELMGWGAFKTPSLRNVALTGPYMHNGRFLTLRQLLDFYEFDNPDLIPAHAINNPDLHPEMGRLGLNPDGLILGQGKVNLVQVQDSEALLFFLLCLTDERVKYEKAPFDHPSIRIVNGFDGGDPANEHWFEVTAVGADGRGDTPPKFPTGE